MRRPKKIPERLPTVRLLTVKEVCEILNYSRVHLWRLECTGKFIRRVQVGAGRVGYYEHELEEWLESRPRAPIRMEAPLRWGMSFC